MKNTYSYKYRLMISLVVMFVLSSSCYCQDKNIQSKKDSLITTIFFVRHAEKVIDESDNPELNNRGKERAEKLSFILEKSGITKIYSTDYKRTKDTVKPLADKLELKILLYDPANKKFLKELLSENKGTSIIIVGHSNTIPGMINEVLNSDSYDQLDDNEYDKLFIVNIIGEKSKCNVIQF